MTDHLYFDHCFTHVSRNNNVIWCRKVKRNKPSPKIKENIFFSTDKSSIIELTTAAKTKDDDDGMKENQEAEDTYYENTTFISELESRLAL